MAMDELIERIESLAAHEEHAGVESGRSQKGKHPPYATEAEGVSTKLENEELLGVFLEEAGAILDTSESLLEQRKNDRENAQLVRELQRQVHTFKGGARMAAIAPVSNLSHAVESVLAAVLEEGAPVSAQLIGLVQQAQDRLVPMLAQVRDNASIELADILVKAIHGLVSQQVGGAATGLDTLPTWASAIVYLVWGVS